MPVFQVEIQPATPDPTAAETRLLSQLEQAGIAAPSGVRLTRLFLLDGDLDVAAAERIGRDLLADPVTERVRVRTGQDPETGDAARTLEVHLLPGVMDPVAESTLGELRASGWPVSAVRTARRIEFDAPVDVAAVGRLLANDCIERVVPGMAPLAEAPVPPESDNTLRTVAVRGLSAENLADLSRRGHLFLSVEEMTRIQAHFDDLGREPTDLELETLAQTWSEHCVHKTLKSAVVYDGAPLPGDGATARRYGNLLRDTIAAATHRLMQEGRGPECLSVFVDNAGVIGFDETHGVAFKVETHNRPSAIEPYGGAATGIGGCIRDVLGCGLGARPIANTNVFCVGPQDWPQDGLPRGVLHPRRVLRGVVSGVADYGNRMGIPTVNGALQFDARYLGNPLVYCGCVGLLPRDRVEKAAGAGDRIVVLGGRTGRDGIHGATFSSAELTDTHADEFSHAVQIGNAITEKRCVDAVLRARDAAEGCLYSAITDCGAGGLSSAVGEMGEQVGARVDLADVPLKYSGLRYDEIWISEAQERMVLAVPERHLDAFLAVAAAEQVEATVIGTFGHADETGAPLLEVRFRGTTVGQLDMAFLHDGWPRTERAATWQPPAVVARANDRPFTLAGLRTAVDAEGAARRNGIIRCYDHEVQGGSVVKPLMGPGQGPTDAAVIRPVLGGDRGVAIGCGLAPELADADPYYAALAGIDEALRNVVAVGGRPDSAAVLDNFCLGRCDTPARMGVLVRMCQACHDGALAYGVPFISGKDSLNNEFALHAEDTGPLLDLLAARGWATDEVRAEIAARGRVRIPDTLLVSAMALVPDVRRCVTPDLKQPGADVLLLPGLDPLGFDPARAAEMHRRVADAIADGLVAACHDVSHEGWAVAVAEMAVGGLRGVDLAEVLPSGAFAGRVASYVLEARGPELAQRLAASDACKLGTVSPTAELAWGGETLALGRLLADAGAVAPGVP